MQRGEDNTKVYVFADTTRTYTHTCAISPAVTQHMQQRQHKLMANRRRG